MKKVSITHLSNAHGGWLRSLDFYKTELKMLKNRLAEIAGRNTERDVTRDVERYEDQLKTHNRHIDQLTHDIRSNVNEAAREAETSKAGYIDPRLVTQHNHLEEKFEEEERHISQLRHDFNQFASEWM
jgi:chromosome segregation ATPase